MQTGGKESKTGKTSLNEKVVFVMGLKEEELSRRRYPGRRIPCRAAQHARDGDLGCHEFMTSREGQKAPPGVLNNLPLVYCLHYCPSQANPSTEVTVMPLRSDTPLPKLRLVWSL